ncbi:MAG: DUF2281 domain-containing protein [Chloroflexi bacterium CG07_land_8_20_14_0_80_51_10]|nr:MAG: DUF2281 domain-containing protein [Chloroflexi bacterium CG07_land_8_20_14_0_80_51_10]
MEVKDIIVREIDRVPEQYLTEILDSIRSLETKALEEGIGTAIASETSLKKDWLNSEEDEAWQDL